MERDHIVWRSREGAVGSVGHSTGSAPSADDFAIQSQGTRRPKQKFELSGEARKMISDSDWEWVTGKGKVME